jgi:endonuclease YncB( thermonuclease family)
MHLKTKTGAFLTWLTIAELFFHSGPRANAQGQAPDAKRTDSSMDSKSAQRNQIKPAETQGQSTVIRDRVNGLERITGKVKVLNAHTLVFEDGTEVELNGGMDAPELDQKGLHVGGGAFYPCGKEAAEFLRKMIGDQKVACFVFGRKGNKVRGDCFVEETHLEIEMVRNGWALAHHEGMEAWQAIAREKKRGLRRGEFVAPERWRKGERLPGE